MRMTVETDGGPAAFTIRLRVPEELQDAEILVNGVHQEKMLWEKGYVRLQRLFVSGDTVEIRGEIPLIRETIGESDAFRYGCIVLARDEAKEPGFDTPAMLPDDPVSWRMLTPEEDETVRIRIDQRPGMPPLLLTDYASCGRRWDRKKNTVTVWMRRSTADAPDAAAENGG